MKNNLSLDWVTSVPKIINENGCWIPIKKPESTGYVHVTVGGERYLLHRLSMCLYYGLDYDNKRIETRHSSICSRACFNYEHLQPGTPSANQDDRVKDGNHYNANKEVCPSCGGSYIIRVIKTGTRKGRLRRDCPKCSNSWNRSKNGCKGP